MTTQAVTGAQLRARRVAAGWSQQNIARRLGIAQSRVAYLEAGTVRRPEPYTAYAALLDQIEAGP